MEEDLSEAQAARLWEVQTQLDTLDAQDPHEQTINARIKQTYDELDAILIHLRSLSANTSQEQIPLNK
jgi:hypothetical protein